jgi:hypothetical protein
MEIYNGRTCVFNLAGVPSSTQRQMRMQHVELAAGSVLHSAAFVASKLGLSDVLRDIMQSLEDGEA